VFFVSGAIVESKLLVIACWESVFIKECQALEIGLIYRFYRF